MPPSTLSVWPVMNAASSEANEGQGANKVLRLRKTVDSLPLAPDVKDSSAGFCSVPGVRVNDGAMTSTVTPSLPTGSDYALQRQRSLALKPR